MTTQSLTITPADLKELLGNVLPFAGKDAFMPLFASVRLEVRGESNEWLTASATDRYAMGVSKIAHQGGMLFSATIPVATCKQLLRFYPVVRRAEPLPVTLTVEDGMLTSSQPGAATMITCSSRLTEGDFPDLYKVVSKGMAGEPAAGPVFHDSRRLAIFGHLGDLAIVPTGTGKMTLIIAHNFVGAVAAQRTVGNSAEKVNEYTKRMTAEWATVLGIPAGEADAA